MSDARAQGAPSAQAPRLLVRAESTLAPSAFDALSARGRGAGMNELTTVALWIYAWHEASGSQTWR